MIKQLVCWFHCLKWSRCRPGSELPSWFWYYPQCSSHPTGEIHACEVFLHRPGVQERDPGCHPSGWVQPDRGSGGRLRPDAGGPHGGSPPVLHQARYRFKNSTEALQSSHIFGNINIPSAPSLSGITKLRFKPAYNPYTEPSMEVFSYHEGKRSDHLQTCCFPSMFTSLSHL